MLLAAWYHFPLALVFLVLAILLMGVILLQRGRGVGLSGAFGGAGLHTAFGSKTGDVLTWATIVLAGVFLLYSVLMNYVFVPQKAANAIRISAPAAPANQLPIDPGIDGGAGSSQPPPGGQPGATNPPAGPVPAQPVNPGPVNPAPTTQP